MFAFLQSHWLAILAAIGSAYTFLVETASRISQYMPAPTAESTQRYKTWFVIVNVVARNPARAKNYAPIEQSPNFEAAAQAYMQKKLQQQGETTVKPGGQ